MSPFSLHMIIIGQYSKTLSLGEVMSEFRRRIEGDLLACGAEPDPVAELIIAMNEALVNIVRHGYKTKSGWVEISLLRDGNALTIKMVDNAPLFDPTATPSPDITLPLAQRPLGGMGIHMMREFVDELHYQVTEHGRNQLTLIKHQAFPQR